MARMKGFYFSLDALTASMILMATVAMVSGYNQEAPAVQKPFQLDNVHTASIQETSKWNNTINSESSVLGHIYTQYFQNPSEAEKICNEYFNQTQNYALYMVNSTSQQKICGDYSISQESNLAVKQTLFPDLPVSSEFRGPYKAVMVMPN